MKYTYHENFQVYGMCLLRVCAKYVCRLDNVKIGNLKRKNRDKKVPKQDEDAGNLQILLHLKSLF